MSARKWLWPTRPTISDFFLEEVEKTQNRLWRPEGRKEEVEEDQRRLGRTV
jgi:hypothetical protein